MSIMTEPQSMILPFPHLGASTPTRRPVVEDPIVLPGIGIGASLGASREQVWQSIQRGDSGVRLTREGDRIGSLRLPCGMVDWVEDSRRSVRRPSGWGRPQLVHILWRIAR